MVCSHVLGKNQCWSLSAKSHKKFGCPTVQVQLKDSNANYNTTIAMFFLSRSNNCKWSRELLFNFPTSLNGPHFASQDHKNVDFFVYTSPQVDKVKIPEGMGFPFLRGMGQFFTLPLSLNSDIGWEGVTVLLKDKKGGGIESIPGGISATRSGCPPLNPPCTPV